MNKIQQHLNDGLIIDLSKNTSMVDTLLKTCNSYYEKPVHNLQAMKMRNEKVKGDIFEYFCQLYLKYCYGLKEVWLLNEIPTEMREFLNLGKNDFGIDLVGIDEDNKYYAIQSKFRKRNSTKKISVTWKQLSTFYALCARTGPYEKYIVITTADYVRRVGKKSEKDVIIGFNKLKNISHFKWMEMCNVLNDNQLNTTSLDTPTPSKTLTNEELRQKRLLFYQKI